MKNLFFVFVVIMFLCGNIFSSTISSSLIENYENARLLKEKLIENNFNKKSYLYEFLYENAGIDYVKRNKRYIKTLLNKKFIRTSLESILKNYIKDKKKRKKIISRFHYPELSKRNFILFKNKIDILLDKLRMPILDHNYKYAHYEKHPGEFIEKQKLVAKHEIGSFQKYEKTFNKKIYRIHLYSPTKIGMFGGNRDVYLNYLSISYWKNRIRKNIVKKYELFLTRGESIDFELPEIADKVNIILSFACKREHKNKAVFYIEPISAELVDNNDSPYIELIEQIKSFSFGNSLEDENRALENIMLSLVKALKNSFNSSVSKSNESSDQLKYFYYLISDEDISRNSLKKKFKKMFMK